jgi:16S rRNA A1518/A1519 N6-dimethyltransferase RsmA/KsgA/DIM1 with predicted DNA glycosylase/AP lyase activity
MSGLEVKTGRRFKQGHDARRKSILIEIEYLEEGQGAMAEELIQRGWRTQAEWDERLGRRIDKRVAKDTKAKVKAEKAAAREAEKQARAQAKVAKPQLPPKARRRNG